MTVRIVKRGTGITVRYDVYSDEWDDSDQPEPDTILSFAKGLASKLREELEETEANPPFKEDSREDFAIRKLRLCEIILDAFKKKHFIDFANFAYELGYLQSEENMKWGFEEDVMMNQDFRLVQKVKSEEGHKVRWRGRGAVNTVLQRLAFEEDEIGDVLPIKDLWSKFYNTLDEAQLRPNDSSGSEPVDSDRMTWNTNVDGIAFKTFRNKIGDIRRKK